MGITVSGSSHPDHIQFLLKTENYNDVLTKTISNKNTEQLKKKKPIV